MRKLVPALLLLLSAACDKSGGASSNADAAAPAGSSSAAASDANFGVVIGGPYDVDKVIAGVNPEHKKPYSGPKGTLRGVIRVDGDPPPDTGLKFPTRCTDSDVAYGKLFRVGLDHALADALVAVTRYDGFVPAESEAVRVDVHDCVPDRLTYAVTFGQRLEFRNVDNTGSYLPYLDGAKSRTIMVAVPKGDPVNLYPAGPSPAHYMIRDQLGSGLVANVFLLNYATHAVTGLDGKYEIRNIPVGKVRVDVMMPVIVKSEGREIDIVEGDNTLDLTMHFDAEKDLPKHAATPPDAGAPDAAASAKHDAGAAPATKKRP